MDGINLIKKIISLWNQIGNRGFWGGIFDSRFYVINSIYNKNFNTLLDLGSGRGIILHLIKAKVKVGIEIDFEAILDAKKLDSSLEIICGDSLNLPFKENCFNTILSMYSVSGFRLSDDRKRVFEEVYRVSSKRKSELIFTENNILSKYLKKVPLEKRRVHLKIDELIDFFKDKYKIRVKWYNAFPKWRLYLLKIILLKSPNLFLKKFDLEERIFHSLISEKEKKDSRAFIFTCIHD